MSVKDLKRNSKTDWARIDQMKDEDIDTSDSPPLDDEYFERAIKVLPRIRLDRIDLKQARRFATYILDNAWTGTKENLPHDAFNTALIVSCCRPFTTRYGLDEKRESPLDLHIHEILTDECELELHERVKKLRDATYAHSDARATVIPGVDYTSDWCFFKAELNLESSEVELLNNMIGKWIAYLDNQIEITKPGGFLIAPSPKT
jgi:hypothetical protein